MTAAELTPTLVEKQFIHCTSSYGTPIKLRKYTVKVTKAAQSDWIDASVYCPGTFLMADGFSVDTNGVQEAPTYTATGTKIVLASAGTGTTILEVYVTPTS